MKKTLLDTPVTSIAMLDGNGGHALQWEQSNSGLSIAVGAVSSLGGVSVLRARF